MKFLHQAFSYFYSTEVTTSACQLKNDFGDFPPRPLRFESPAGKFTTVRVRGIGEDIHFVIMMKRLLEGTADLDSLAPTIRNLMPSELASLKHFGGSKSAAKKTLIWIALAAIFLASILKLIQTGRQGMSSLGYFAPLRKEEYEIVLKIGQIKKTGLDAASMISHEHIHLLQHKGSHVTEHSRDVSLPDDQIFTDSARTNKIFPHIKYLLERNEVEARLHELVVSFYRMHKNLPLNIPSFLTLLAASKQLGWLVSETLTEAKAEFGPIPTNFVERDKMQAKDLEIVLLSLPEDRLLRFITEVLPVMYGNLLKYYGDIAASRKFLSQITRPNFYDQLYPLPDDMPDSGA